jgi:hypothetical protein
MSKDKKQAALRFPQAAASFADEDETAWTGISIRLRKIQHKESILDSGVSAAVAITVPSLFT